MSAAYLGLALPERLGKPPFSMWVQAKLQAVRRKLVSDGLWPTVRLVLRQTMQGIIHREERLYYVDLPHYRVAPGEFGEHVTARALESLDSLTPDELKALLDYAGAGYQSELQDRFAKRWILWLGYVDGETAGGGWALTSATDFRSKIVPLLDTDVSIIDCFTFPAHRGKNVYPAVLSAIANHYARKGFLRAYGYVNQQNAPSIKGLEKAGFRSPIAYETYRIGSSEIVVWKHCVKRAGDPQSDD